MGRQGPDQGFIFTLTGLFDDRLHLGEIERADADAGCIAVALKRSALYGRAPVAADLQMAYAAFGFFDAAAPDELVAWREIAFAGLAHGHHYAERRRLADRISVGSLAVTPEALESAYRRDWQALLGLGD